MGVSCQEECIQGTWNGTHTLNAFLLNGSRPEVLNKRSTSTFRVLWVHRRTFVQNLKSTKFCLDCRELPCDSWKRPYRNTDWLIDQSRSALMEQRLQTRRSVDLQGQLKYIPDERISGVCSITLHTVLPMNFLCVMYYTEVAGSDKCSTNWHNFAPHECDSLNSFVYKLSVPVAIIENSSLKRQALVPRRLRTRPFSIALQARAIKSSRALYVLLCFYMFTFRQGISAVWTMGFTLWTPVGWEFHFQPIIFQEPQFQPNIFEVSSWFLDQWTSPTYCKLALR